MSSSDGWRPLTAAVAAVATAVLLAGCGVPVDRSARALPDDGVPFDLLSDSTTTTVLPGGRGTPDTTLCLTLDGSLLAVTRPGGADRDAASLLSLLTSGPTEGETRVALRSAVDDAVVVSVAASGGTATVDLADEFGELPGDEQLLAVAQMTCTLTAQPGIGRVRFRLGGEHVDVPVQGGSLVGRAVTRVDYERLYVN